MHLSSQPASQPSVHQEGPGVTAWGSSNTLVALLDQTEHFTLWQSLSDLSDRKVCVSEGCPGPQMVSVLQTGCSPDGAEITSMPA